ncbi:MAG: exopolyphosphatase [Lachnospiraceae bacterium]|nr:exopolyphosphatase [Lachnospiraceae bacterium]
MAVKYFAAIGIGSTLTEMKIFEWGGKKIMREVECVSTRMSLGLDVYKKGRIDSKHIEELCQLLLNFKSIMQAYKVDSYKVYATSAFRESRNMLIMRDYIEKQTGFRIGVLSNSEQRFVDYKSIASVTTEFETIIQNAAAIVDIGGSSMQISLFDKDKLITTQNIRVGSVTTKERLAPLTKNNEHFEKMVVEILNHELAGFGKLYQKDRQIKNLIVIGGNLLGLMKPYQNENRKITSVTKSQFEDVYKGVVGLSQNEISEKYNISFDQTGVIVPTAIYCRCLMENLGAETLWFPDYSLCDGMAYDYGVKNRYIKNSHNFEEDIIAAARSISKRYKCSQAHIRNLEEIALQVFDRMKKVHGMGKRERLLLQISIILHNCGKFISLEDVSECAFNIIMATEIIGLSHTEREMIAYTVKFNTSRFLYYDELAASTALSESEYMVVAKMTAILRMVNALDRTHQQKCKNVNVTLKEHELKITVASNADFSLEKGTFNDKAEFFEEIFNVHPVFKQRKQI